MSRNPYITPSSLVSLHDSMSAEEWAVMHDVETMRLATAGHLQRLHALRTELRVRSFRRLLQRLHDKQVLFRLGERTVGGRRGGSAGWVYGIGIAGQRLLQHPPRRPWTPRPSWLAHALAAGHLYVELREAEAVRRLTIDTFESEPKCWRHYEALGGGIIDLKPDAFIRLVGGDYEDSFFVEWDTGTESPSTLSRKLDVYTAAWKTGQEQAETGVFPFVLWLVPDERRADLMRTVIVRQHDAAQLHRVATHDQALNAFIEEPP